MVDDSGKVQPERSFIGREKALAQFMEALESRSWVITIRGVGGVGKTWLLREVAERVKQEKQFFVPSIIDFDKLAHEPRPYEKLLQQLARNLHLQEAPLDDALELERHIQEQLRTKKTLLQFDAAESLSDPLFSDRFKAFLSQVPEPSKVLISGRHELGIGERQIILHGLPFEDAIKMMEDEAERLNFANLRLSDYHQLHRLWQLSGGSPLALKWMIGQIAQRNVPMEVFLNNFSRRISDTDANILGEIFSRSWEQLDRQSQQLLILLAYSDTTLSESELSSIMTLTNSEVTEILNRLERLSLVSITSEGSQISVHPLTRRYIDILLSADIEHPQEDRLLILPEVRGVLECLIYVSGAIDNKREEFVKRAQRFVYELSHLLDVDYLEIASVYRKICGFVINADTMFSKVDALKKLPLVFVQRGGLRRIDIHGAKHVTRTMLGSPRRFCILVLFTDNENLDKARSLVEEERKAIYGFDFVLLTESDFRKIAVTPHPAELLRQLVLSQVDLISISPFVTTGPTPDSVFFGREEVFREIVENVYSASYALIGGRRIGKTSTLNRLYSMHLEAVGFNVLYHDCSTTPDFDTFMAAPLRNWKSLSHEAVYDCIEKLLASPPQERSTVLLLDEADKLIPSDRQANWKLFNLLRSLANTGVLQVVLSGERTLRTTLQDPFSPLFNFANEILIGPLDIHAVEELVTRPFKQLGVELVDAQTIVERIWFFTSGHPNIIQRLCRRLLERLNEQSKRSISVGDVLAVVEDPAFQRNDFLSTYWETATPLEKIISLMIADNPNVQTLNTIRQELSNRCGIYPKAQEVDEALQMLVDLRSILRRTTTGYEFAVKAFPQVVAGTITLIDMLEVLLEEYQEQST